MAKSDEFWKRVYQAFDPQEILLGQRSHELYCEREDSPRERIRYDFVANPARRPTAYFAGHRGSGKSTMLWKLLESLRDEYFIVYFDVEHNLDTTRAHQIDLLYLLGSTIFSVADQEGLTPDPELLKELSQAVFSVTETQSETPKQLMDVGKLASGVICFGASALGGSLAEKTAEKLTKAFLEPFRLTSGVSTEVVRQREIEPQIQQIVTKVNLLISEVETKADKQLLVVVDGLDKIQKEELARLIFLESSALNGPICRIIYTVPISIYMNPAFKQTTEGNLSYLFPNVRTYHKSGRKYGRGCELLEQVVARRLRSIGLEVGEIFPPKALTFLIRKSGGVMRWLIDLVREASTFARIDGFDKITLQAARKAVEDHVREHTARLTMVDIEELNQIRKTKRLIGSDRTADLLQGLFVVAYFNGDTWFDAHPLLWEVLEAETGNE